MLVEGTAELADGDAIILDRVIGEPNREYDENCWLVVSVLKEC